MWEKCYIMHNYRKANIQDDRKKVLQVVSVAGKKEFITRKKILILILVIVENWEQNHWETMVFGNQKSRRIILEVCFWGIFYITMKQAENKLNWSKTYWVTRKACFLIMVHWSGRWGELWSHFSHKDLIPCLGYISHNASVGMQCPWQILSLREEAVGHHRRRGLLGSNVPLKSNRV